MRVVDALIKARKDFDLIVVPGMGHSDGGVYGERRRWDYFVRHLHGVEPPDRNAVAVDGKKDIKPQTDAERMQGTWYGISGKLDGEKIPLPTDGARLVLKGDKFIWTVSETKKEQGTFVLHPDKKPRALDIVIAFGKEKGKTRPAIYLLKEDELWLCIASTQDERPSDFTSEAGQNRLLVVFRRSPP